MSSKVTKESVETCAVCHDDVEIYAVGQCDHGICYRCSTRMRCLCDQMYCAICRTDLPKVLFMKQNKKYGSSINSMRLSSKTEGIYFENEKIQTAFYELTSHKCKLCTCLKPLRAFLELEQHMRREHGLHYCDICVRNLKIFSSERKCYNREKLATHRRLGDADDSSMKGHPLCELCDQRYLDRDELARHCRKDHFHCHFCETDGRSLEFYGDYNSLRDHYGDEHYLCEEGECYHARFTNAFRSEIDFQAHRATKHHKSMKKAEARQARTIEVDFQLAPRPTTYGRSRGRGRRERDHDRGGGTRDRNGQDNPDQEREQRQQYVQQRREEYQAAQAAQAVALHLNDIHRQSGSIAMVDRAVLDAPSLVQQPDISQDPSKYTKKKEDFPTLDGRSKESVNSDDDINQNSSKKDTLAKKLARSSNFSVQDGSMEQKDFPSLGGRGRGKPKTGAYKSAWQAQSSDYPSLSASKSKDTKTTANYPSLSTSKGKDTNPSASNTTNVETSGMIRSKSWAQTTQEQDKAAASSKYAPPKPVIPIVLNTNQVKSSPKLSKKDPTPTQADFPSLSSIGNSLLHITPAAPGLSLTRSSSAAALIQSSGHTQQVEKQPVRKPANFETDDFPTLGGKKANASVSKQWVSNTKSDQGKGRKKDPAPMPEFSTKSEPSVKPMSKQEKPVSQEKSAAKQEKSTPKQEKSTSKQEQMNTANPKKTVRAVMEEKQSKELETILAQQTKSSKKNKGRKSPENSSARGTPDASDGESEKVKKSTKGKKGNASKDDIINYRAASPLEESKSSTSKNSVKEKSKKDAKSHKAEPLKESAKSVDANNKVDSPSEVRKGKVNKSKTDVANYNVDPPKETESAMKDQNSKDKASGLDVSKKNTSKTATPKVSKKIVHKPEDDLSVKSTVDAKTDNFPSLSDLSQSSSIIESIPIKLEDFPTLDSVGKKAKKPPPGFTNATNNSGSRPPPGFVKPSAGSKPPPGFTGPITDNIENVAPALNGNSPVYTYIQPDDFKARNQRLICDIQEMLTTEQFARFKSCSGEFRQGQISAMDYYNKCCDIMSPDKFLVIFHELMSLLPDIAKQQELLVAHTASQQQSHGVIRIGKRSWNSNISLLSTCTTCQQVVLHAELTAHRAHHNTDLDFPSLSSIGASLASWPKK